MHDQGGLGKCRVGALHLHKRMGPIRELVGGVWFVKMRRAINGKCMVQVEIKSIMAHDKTNGRWEG